MKLNEILLFGMILQADIFVDGHGTTEEDEILMKKALNKHFHVTADTSAEDLLKIDKQIDQATKDLVESYRTKIQNFINSDTSANNGGL